MTIEPFLISLPIGDRQRSHDFYRNGLGLTAVGELADDGLPEPLVFIVNEHTQVMLIPTGGFGWVIGENAVAQQGTSECLLGLSAASEDDVARMVERATAAGASVLSEPAARPWGFTATLADPDGHLWMITVSDTD